MATATYTYRYDAQFERYIEQFLRAFSGFQTQDGVDRDSDGELDTHRVPVVYGAMDRIVASILNKRETFTNQKIPIIAANLNGITPNPEEKRATAHVDHISNEALNLPDGIKAVERIQGPPFIMNMEINILASSTTELFQIVEQILLIFNPRLTIQVDTDGYNPDYLSEITLESIDPDIQYPMGTESRTVALGMSFTVPVRLRYPKSLTGGIIHEIRSRILDGNSEEVYFENINDETTA